MENILKTYNLTRKYGTTAVVDNINMNIKKGEIYGFLGRNGAGKTTTLRMIMGLISPTKGEYELFGKKMGDREVFGRIGAIIETPGFYPNLTARENLDIHRRLMGIPNKEYVDEALEIVGLTNYDIKKKKVKKYSLGMKQRLGVARALLHKPELLILDEPTNGLDPVGIKEMRETLLDLNKKKEITILVSSHILGEIQQLATKIGIIHNGKLLEEIDYKSFEKKNKHYINLRVDNDKRAVTILEKSMNIKDYEVTEPNKIRIYEMLDKSNDVAKKMISEGVDVYEVNVMNDTLEDYFVRLTGGGQGA
ncbi:ABC transporter ATP-binding protein [Clostridium botulinum]|uniref:Antibiotic ABC transporter, ATP-binding protein n=2 Tax=Clostridium botulinum TaxID=1491 RepID=A7GFM6_CLOBL|nr:ABC transporter ATP-binding protein [Clostridium botulinum]ABS41241.1 antibiotic ABC transporter, ATP-binding protein [Clostridium botulinum F str. Langeland]ADF99991.1 antibiotic ABC transporter, ATP-binding protein [Clostridium botulinum F str. 230613]KKM42445.1 bacitracin ABC transporter ATP-binding protein [Clostridium botulinum]MBY6793067.1 ABC transporter ATP-binding protein [Clostridium botulinum]MBY6937277.1 ABC transporter ATP-binding protein [Clostridium botulinum]